MKSILEEVPQTASLSWLINPKLNDFYFWHFHPAFELVYIEADYGRRHVGTHKGEFKINDMVFIGSNIPHLNFDFGIKGPYHKTVLHIDKTFLENLAKLGQETAFVHDLIENSKYGILFGEGTKKAFGTNFKEINRLEKLEQILAVTSLLKRMLKLNDYTLLHDKIPENNIKQREEQRLKKVLAYVDSHYKNKITLSEAAEICSLGEEAFCRYFKKMTKLSFITFLNHYRIHEAKLLLIAGSSVSEACFEVGFESQSYFCTVFKKITGYNPSQLPKP